MERRRWSADDRARILEKTLTPGAVVSAVARRLGLSLANWHPTLSSWGTAAAAKGGAMSLAKSVSEEPEVTILRWGIMVDPLGYRLVGYHGETGRGRVTSPIVEFDEHSRLARTESGRRYHLSGEPDPTAAAVLIRAHMQRWGLSLYDIALADPSEIALALAPRPAAGRLNS